MADTCEKCEKATKGVPPPLFFSMWPILGQTLWRHILHNPPPPVSTPLVSLSLRHCVYNECCCSVPQQHSTTVAFR